MCSGAPPAFVTVMVCAALDVPCVMVPIPRLPGERATIGVVGGAGVAVPAMLMICGESEASSVKVMVSLRSPAARGVKVIVMLHVAFEFSVATQADALVLKSDGLLPPTVAEEMCRAALPELVTTMVIGLLVVPCMIVGKFSGFGEIVTAGAGGGGATPAPVSCTDCGLLGALSVTMRAACCEPVAVGANTMLTVQKLLG